MANRLEQIKRIKQGVEFAGKHIDESNWHGAVVVHSALIAQLLALIEGEDLDSQTEADVVITFEEDCGNVNGT